MLRVMPSIRAYTFTHTQRALCIHRSLVALKWDSFVAGFADLLDVACGTYVYINVYMYIALCMQRALGVCVNA